MQALGTALRNAGELTESLKNASRELQPAMANRAAGRFAGRRLAPSRPRAKWAIWRSRRASPWPA